MKFKRNRSFDTLIRKCKNGEENVLKTLNYDELVEFSNYLADLIKYLKGQKEN